MLHPAAAEGAAAEGIANEYDFSKRDPQHSGAGAAHLWELCGFEHHYHPSVSKPSNARVCQHRHLYITVVGVYYKLLVLCNS